MNNMSTLDGFIIIAIISIVVYISHKFVKYIRHDLNNERNGLDYFIDQLNVDYGGDWYYDEAEDIYRDTKTDRTYRRKEAD